MQLVVRQGSQSTVGQIGPLSVIAVARARWLKSVNFIVSVVAYRDVFGGFANSKLISPDTELEVAEVILGRELVARSAKNLDGQVSDASLLVRGAVLSLRIIANFVAAETALRSAGQPTRSGKGAAREGLATCVVGGEDSALAAQRHRIAMGQLVCPWAAHACSASKRGAERGAIHFAPEMDASEVFASNLKRVAGGDTLSILMGGEVGASADDTSTG